jgi:prepilin-type N-terminal cleavage/methylation domain-containing protein
VGHQRTQRRRLSKRPGRAFTLVELLIVFMILGIVAALVVPQLSEAAIDARDGGVASQVSTIEAQIELFNARNGRYPTSAELAAAPADPSRGSGFGILVDHNYLEAAPVNPYTGGARIGVDWAYDEVLGRVSPVRP